MKSQFLTLPLKRSGKTTLENLCPGAIFQYPLDGSIQLWIMVGDLEAFSLLGNLETFFLGDAAPDDLWTEEPCLIYEFSSVIFWSH